MKHNRKNKQFIYVMVILLVTFMLCLSFSPLAYIENGKLNLHVKISESMSGMNESSTHVEYNPLLINLPIRETFTENEIIPAIDEEVGIWNYRRSSNNRIFAFVLPIISIELLAYALLTTYRKLNKHMSVLAISIGGHAPPIIWA